MAWQLRKLTYILLSLLLMGYCTKLGSAVLNGSQSPHDKVGVWTDGIMQEETSMEVTDIGVANEFIYQLRVNSY